MTHAREQKTDLEERYSRQIGFWSKQSSHAGRALLNYGMAIFQQMICLTVLIQQPYPRENTSY